MGIVTKQQYTKISNLIGLARISGAGTTSCTRTAVFDDLVQKADVAQGPITTLLFESHACSATRLVRLRSTSFQTYIASLIPL